MLQASVCKTLAMVPGTAREKKGRTELGLSSRLGVVGGGSRGGQEGNAGLLEERSLGPDRLLPFISCATPVKVLYLSSQLQLSQL